MATVDLSRSATDFRKRYRSVRAQMGVVFTDDDHNDNERIHLEDDRRTRVDVIGGAGTPDQGFCIDNVRIDGGKINFNIMPGAFYLGGYRCELDQLDTFQMQKDWLPLHPGLMPAAPVAGTRTDL